MEEPKETAADGGSNTDKEEHSCDEHSCDENDDDSIKEGTAQKEILNELETIKTRLQSNVASWEVANWTYKGIYTQNNEGDVFPKGFGFYLNNISQIDDDEDDFFQSVRESIVKIPSLEIQDGLLSFLDEYKIQEKCVKNMEHARDELLAGVRGWLKADVKKIDRFKTACMDNVLNADELMNHCYLTMMKVLEQLLVLKKKMMVIERTQKEPDKKRQIQLSDIDKFISTLEDTTGVPVSKHGFKSIDDLFNMLESIKDKSNEDVVYAIEGKLDSISNILQKRETEIKAARVDVRSKIREQEKVKERINAAREYNKELRTQIQELLEQQAIRAREAAGFEDLIKSKPQKSLFREDFSCQVTIADISAPSISVVDTSIPLVLEKHEVSFKATSQKVKRIASLLEKGPRVSKSKVGGKQAHRGPKEAAKSKAWGKIKQMKNMGAISTDVSGRKQSLDLDALTVDEPQEGETVVKPSPGKEEEASTKEETSTGKLLPEGIHKLRLEGQKASGVPRKKSTMERERKHTTQETDEEPPERLVRRHINNLVKLIQPLLKELIALRRNTRKEIGRVKAREQTMGRIVKTMQELFKTAPEDACNVPVLKLDREKGQVIVSNRHTQPHQCPLCVCKDTNAPTVDLNYVKSRATQRRTLEMFDEYVELVTNIKNSYDFICTKIRLGHEEIQHCITQLVMGDWLGTTNLHDLEEDLDSKMIRKVLETRNMPEDPADQVKHAVFVTTTTRLLVRDIVGILMQSRQRLNDVKIQNEQLKELEKAIGLALACMDDNVLHLTRLRADQDVLKYFVILGEFKCQCCQCYNSPLNDGTRVFDSEDAIKRTQLILTRNMALLQQGVGAILRTTEDMTTLALGTKPGVVEDIQGIQCQLSEALHTLVNASEEPNETEAQDCVADNLEELNKE